MYKQRATGGNVLGEETNWGKLFRVRDGGGGFVTHVSHRAITWGNTAREAGLYMVRGMTIHIYGVLTQDSETSGVPSARMFDKVLHRRSDEGEFMYKHFCSNVVVLQEGMTSLPRYNMCGIHMPTEHLLKNQRMARCFKNTEMWITRRDG